MDSFLLLQLYFTMRFKIKTAKIIRKKVALCLVVVLGLALTSLSCMYPSENIFINFKSPESVLSYTKYGEIVDVLYGKESAIVIYSNKNSTGCHYIIPKTENGYKIPNYFSAKKISNKFDRNGSFDVYNVLGTQDYYIIGTILSNDLEQNIVDSHNEPVNNIVINMGNTETKTVIIYSYVENYTDDYYFIINGTKTPVNDQ